MAKTPSSVSVRVDGPDPLRITALQLASGDSPPTSTPEEVVSRAQAYFTFLSPAPPRTHPAPTSTSHD